MIYWSAGSLFVSNDQKRDPVLMFNNSNVKDGSFVYNIGKNSGEMQNIRGNLNKLMIS